MILMRSLRRAGITRGLIAAVALFVAGCATGAADFEQGKTLAGQQKWDDAIRAYEQALVKEPDNAQYRVALAQAREAAAQGELRSATAVAGAMAQIADVDRGLAGVERALRYDPQHQASREFQSRLRDRRAALAREVERLLTEGRAAAQREDWPAAEQAAIRALAIDPGNDVATRQREAAVQGGIAKSLRLAAAAEAAEEWREAAKYLEEALGRDPNNDAVQARLRTAQQRDSLAYYLGRAGQFEAEGQLEKAFAFLKLAAKYWPADVRVRDAMDRVAREGRRKYYTEALRRAENDDWGKVYASLAQAVQGFGAPNSVDGQLRSLVRDLAARLYDRALEFENQKLSGNTYLWFRTLQQVDPVYRDVANKVEQTRERLMDRATVKIAILDFEPPKAAPDAGSILSGSIVTNLFKVGRKDFKVIEREALQSIIKEISIGQAGVLDVETAKEIGKIAGIDVILVGRVLQYKVDQNEAEGRKTVTVQVGNRTISNPAYELHLAAVREGRKKSTDPSPAQTIQEPVHQLFSYRIGTVTAIGYVSVSFRLVGVERGEILLAEKIDEQETFKQDFSEGVEAAGIQAVSKNAPIPTEVLNRVSDQVVQKIVQLIAKHYGSRQSYFLETGRELQRRRQFTRAVEEYMNAIASADLEKAGEQYAALARNHVEELLRQ
jgi:curli biogenesis system outer membrane secretion channel CsgG/tetratricopeptide (TPR) repeat protein